MDISREYMPFHVIQKLENFFSKPESFFWCPFRQSKQLCQRIMFSQFLPICAYIFSHKFDHPKFWNSHAKKSIALNALSGSQWLLQISSNECLLFSEKRDFKRNFLVLSLRRCHHPKLCSCLTSALVDKKPITIDSC